MESRGGEGPGSPRIQIRQDIRFWEAEAHPHEAREEIRSMHRILKFGSTFFPACESSGMEQKLEATQVFCY